MVVVPITVPLIAMVMADTSIQIRWTTIQLFPLLAINITDVVRLVIQLSPTVSNTLAQLRAACKVVTPPPLPNGRVTVCV